MQLHKNQLLLILGYGIVLTVALWNGNNSFFWDGVHYGAIQPDFYYASHFSSIWVPDGMDSGEVPTFAVYIAAVWTCFGRTLLASHLAMVPFIIGIVWQLFSLCKKFIKPQFTGITLLLILTDTTLLSQCSLVTPDLPLVFFFLLALNALLEQKSILLTVAVCFLFMGITRGILLAFCLFLLDLYLSISETKNPKTVIPLLFKKSMVYIPGFILFVIYNYCHFIHKGWILSYEGSPWEGTKELVDAHGLLVNIVLLCWRLVDFGKIIIWMIFLILLFRLKKQSFSQYKPLVFLSVSLLLFVHVDMLWASNLMAHRYFMPFHIVFALLCASILFSDRIASGMKYLLIMLWFGVMISGSFWIYPDKIAKGWDATLAHLPYYQLRHQAIGYLDKKEIDFKEVGSFFPNTAVIDMIDLNHDMRNFDNYNGKDRYVFYSNIFNIEDTQYDEIHDKENYKEIKRFENNGVFVVIFEKLQ